MKHLRWVMLAICFFIDVRVRAEVLHAPHGPKSFTRGTQRLDLGRASLLEIREGLPHLVRGDLLLEAKTDAKLSVPFAVFTCAKACRALARRNVDHVTFMSLAGEWTYRRTGDAQAYALPVATQVRLGEVTPAGVAAAEFPHALPWTETVALWARLGHETSAEFKAHVTAFRPTWRAAVENLSERHAEVARAEIARHVAAVEAQARARRAEDEESARLRRLFRQKNGFAE